MLEPAAHVQIGARTISPRETHAWSARGEQSRVEPNASFMRLAGAWTHLDRDEGRVLDASRAFRRG